MTFALIPIFSKYTLGTYLSLVIFHFILKYACYRNTITSDADKGLKGLKYVSPTDRNYGSVVKKTTTESRILKNFRENTHS